MTRRLLLGGAAVLLGVLLFPPLSRLASRKSSDPRLASLQERIDAQRRQDLKTAIAKNPQIAGPMKSYRVQEERNEDRMVHRGAGYVASTSAKGPHFEAAGAFLELKASRLEQGGQTVAVSEGALSSPTFGDVRIDRGVLTEQYIFENERAEQIFRVAQPLGSGALRVVVALATNLSGKVVQQRRQFGGWKDTTLQDGGLGFTNERGELKIAYHGAVAFDASGRRVDLDPTYKGGEISLEVPAEFMAQAVYPVTIDPWLELDFSASAGGISNSSTVSQTPSVTIVGGGNPWVTWSEQVLDATSGLSQFEVFFRYWNGFKWVSLGGSNSGNGISNNSGDSINPVVTKGDIGPYIAWQDDSSGTTCVYVKHWDGSSWVELASDTPFNASPVVNSGSNGGVSLGIGTYSANPAIGETFVTVPSTGKVVLVPVVAYESTNPGPYSIIAAAFFPGDPGQQLELDPTGTFIVKNNFPVIPKGWYALGGNGAASQYAVIPMSNPSGGVSQHASMAIPSFSTDATGAVIAWDDTRAGTHDIMAAQYVAAGFGNDNMPIFPTSRPPNFAFGSWNDMGGSFVAGGITGNNAAAAPFSLNPSLALDPTGLPAIAWEHFFSLTDSDIYLLQFDGAVWQEVNGSASGRGVSNTAPGLGGTNISQTPSLTIDNNGTYYVAWQDDEPGNAEIYVRRNSAAGGWLEAGFNSNSASVAPALGIGGVSQTVGASVRPSIAANGGATLAWQDFAGGKQEIFVRRFFENQPLFLRQTEPGGGTVIPFGSSTILNAIDLRAIAFSETLNLFVYMEVEIVPVGSPFVGKNIQKSGQVLVSDPLTHQSIAEMVVPFSGLVNTPFQWRARTVDEQGNTSAWISAGGSDGVSDFAVNVASQVAPGTPSNLIVSLVGGVVTLNWTAPAGGADSYNIKRSTVAGGGGYPPATIISTGGAVTGTTYSDLSAVAGTTYFYVVSAVRGGLESATNSNEVTITVPAGSGGIGANDSVDKKRCGLMGGEALVLLAGAIFLRRRRR